MFIVPTQPQTAWQVVQSGFSLWKSTFRFVWPFSVSFATINALNSYYNVPPAEGVENNAIATVSFVIFFISTFVNTAIIYAIHRGRGHQPCEAPSCLGLLRKTWLFFMVSFLTGLMIFLGTLCFIIPGIILSIYIVFAPYLAVIDQEGGIKQSIRSSFELTSHYWWFLANRLTVIIIVSLMLFLGVLLIVLGLSSFSASVIPEVLTLSINSKTINVPEKMQWILALAQHLKSLSIPISWISSAFLYPIGHAFMLETLYDLRLRKASPSV